MDDGSGRCWHCGCQEAGKKMLILLMQMGGGRHRQTNSVDAVSVAD